ncbi:Amidase [Paenibacillus sp. yr247]|nr:Amidase [Paenibacillus sp. yr247]
MESWLDKWIIEADIASMQHKMNTGMVTSEQLVHTYLTRIESFAAADSFVAAQLRAAGAVLLGKTNMTEWAGFMSNEIWAGYSSRGGLTLNPYGPGELFVGGSSSGSAAAIAANLAAVAIGTETSANHLCRNI